MKKYLKKLICLAMSTIMIVGSPLTVFASDTTNSSMTLNEAKEYLKTYKVTQKNSLGKDCTTQYTFKSEDDLNKVAAYIVENGLENFHNKLNLEVSKIVSKEPKSTLPMPRTVSPITAYANISGNGNHDISKTAYGLASFKSLGTLEYSVKLGYRATVTNGKISSVSRISFDIPYISNPSGSWGKLYAPSYVSDKSCGVTANFVITKTLTVGIGGGGISIKEETDNEVFSITTKLIS